MNTPTEREDVVDVVAVLNAMEELVLGAKAEYLEKVYTLDQPTIGHQRTIAEVARAMDLPDDLDALTRMLNYPLTKPARQSPVAETKR